MPPGTLPGSAAAVSPLHWAQALRPCALSAVLATLAMLLGLVFPAATLGAGFVAVALYHRRNPAVEIGAGIGARLGAISGFFCSILSAILLLVASSYSDFRQTLREKMLEGASRWASSRAADPDVQAALEKLKSPEGFVASLVLGIVLVFLLCIVLAAGGGALGSVFFRRKKRT